MKKKHVLIIAYLFPPIGGGGVQRALKMAKYLGDYGCKVSVLTVDEPRHVSLDPSLLEQLPKDVTIYRAKEVKLPGMGTKVVATNKSSSNSSAPSMKQRLIQQLKPILKKVKEQVLIPDDQILWLKNAVRLGEEIIKKETVDVIFSTSGPYTNHLVGLQLKNKTGVRWIADFRDPWTQNMHRPTSKRRLKIEDQMEYAVISHCDILMTVTHSFANNFKKKYGSTIKRLEVIHNGFDPADYKNLQKNKLFPNKWTFVYTGIFYQERNPRLFLQAVAELIKEGKIDRNDLSIQFAGVFDYPGYTDNQDCVRDLGLEDVVYVWGNLPHKDALSLLAGADQLLLIGDVSADSGAYIPGKLFEYMAVQKPIFALTVAGESANIISEQKLGVIIPPFDKERIKTELLKAYHNWQNNNELKISPTNTLPYQRDEQAKMLANIVFEQ